MIVGITGFIGSGKDTIADYLVTFKGFRRMSFAEPLKDAVSAIFNWDRELLEGKTAHSREWREQVDEWWSARLAIPNLTPRWVLQYWGTEVCRIGFHEEIWIASVERKLSLAMNSNFNYINNIVIPDTRFPNEIKMIRKLGGQVWAVKRGEDPDWLVNLITKGEEPNDIHPSEWSWVTENVDHIIDNNGTIDDLKNKVSTLLNNIHT